MDLRRALGLGIVASLAALAVTVVASSVVRSLDLRLYDTLLRAAGPLPPSERVAVVGVDDSGIGEFGQWPWSRAVTARLVDSLLARGASVVAFDMLMADADRLGAGDSPSTASGALTRTDSIFARVVGNAPVVLGYAFSFGGADRLSGAPCVLHPLSVVLVERPGRPSPLAPLFQPTSAVCGLTAFSRAANASGFLNASADADGVLRRVPLLMAAQNKVYPSLVLAALARAGAVKQVGLEVAPDGRPQLTLDSVRVPLDARGALLVRFRGKVRTFPHLAAADVLKGQVPRGALEGRIVFVGATALGLSDVVATPFDHAYLGLEVHATLAANLLERVFVDVPSWSLGASLLLALLMGLGSAVAVARWGLLGGGIGVGLAALALWPASLWSMASMGTFLSPVAPTFAFVLTMSTLLIAGLRKESHRARTAERRRESTHLFAVESLTALTETRDQSTGGHARRTRAFAELLAGRLRHSPRFATYLTDERVAAIAQLAPLHDIGKVGIADAVLQKPGRLAVEEYDSMKTHPELGYQIIARAEQNASFVSTRDRDVVEIAKQLVRTHHERWNGSGYPHGLAGDNIPIPGRIMAVVDVYDALVQKRVYRDAMTHEEAVALLAAGRGTDFDPEIVDAFLELQEEFRHISLRLRDADTPAQPVRAQDSES